MTWQAPELAHLLDQRLQAARVDLFDDPRMEQALHGRGRERTAFLRHLIEEKLAAAARSGIGAVEASLRSSASDHLTKAGLEPAATRARLDALSETLYAIESRRPHAMQRDPLRPTTTATLFFVGWLATASTGWAVGNGNTPLFLVLLLIAMVATPMVYLLAQQIEQQRRRTIAKEYPVLLCRTYLAAATDAITGYEATVNQLTVDSG
jgi:hypothetical protein